MRHAFSLNALLGLVLFALPTQAQDIPTTTIERDGVKVQLTPRRGGLQVNVGGLTVIKHSDIVVTRPPWAPHFYVGPDHTAVATANVRQTPDPQIVVQHRSANGEFEAEETFTLLPDGKLEQIFVARLQAPAEKALIQWRMGGLNPALLIGRPFEARLSDGTERAGTVPVLGQGGSRQDRTLAEGFASLTFDSRIGPITIRVPEAPDLVVYDFRTDRWAEPRDPYLWFGDLRTILTPDAPVRYHVIYDFPSADATDMTEKILEAKVATLAAPQAQTFPTREPRLVPQPKELNWTADELDVSAWQQQPPAAPELASAVAAHGDLLGYLATLPKANAADAPAPALTFATTTDATLPAEGYALVVDPAGVRLTARDAAGFRHAVRTLKQLIRPNAEGRLIATGVGVRDWPSLPFRGVHMFTGGQGPRLHFDLIEHIVAGLKMNHVILEAEYVEWDSQPEIHHPEYGMPKSEVRDILALCERLGVTLTPLVNSLGHMQWAFYNDHNLEFAEDPEAKWAYTVTNPKSYEFIFEVYEEALELFGQPEWFHIGHDEFDDRGRVPYRESSKPYTVAELFMMDIAKHHGWFEERGKRMMIWGDMLLADGEAPDATHAKSQEEAEMLREATPDNVIITDWHYIDTAPENFTSLEIFQSEGHDVIASTWYRPGNITNFAKAAYDNDSLGFLQTTWAGYSLDPQSFAREMHQYGAWVLAAEAAWNAENPPDPSTYPAQSLFIDLMNLSALRPANRAGWTADLTAAYNYRAAANADNGWFGLGAQHDLRKLATGQTRAQGVAFMLADNVSQPSVLVLQSKLTEQQALPSEVQLALDAQADTLVLLTATNFASQAGTPIADLTLRYTDKTEHSVTLTYGENVAAYTDLNALPGAPVAWTGATPAGQAVALRAVPINNPQPGKTIELITLKSRNAAGGLMLFGLTGLDGAATSPAEE